MKKIVLLLFLILFVAAACSSRAIQAPVTVQEKTKKQNENIVYLTKADLCKTYSFSSYTRAKTFDFETRLIVKTAGENNSILAVDVALPQNSKGKQNVRKIEFSPEPEKLYQSGENIFAMFRFENPKSREMIKISGRVNVNTYDYDSAKNKPVREILSPSAKMKYISPEKMIESKDKDIVETAKSLKRNSDVNTTFAIYNYVVKNTKYIAQAGVQSAKETLLKKTGKCTDYSALMVALCRANGIPARIVSGNTIDGDGIRHSWVEVYFDKYGWVYFEPTINTVSYMTNSPHTYFVTARSAVNTAFVRLRHYDDKGDNSDIVLDDVTTFKEVKQ